MAWYSSQFGTTLGWSVAAFAILLGIGFVILAIGIVAVKDGNQNRRIVDLVAKCSDNIIDKFKQVRTSAIVFGVMLTIIILSLLTSDVMLSKKAEEVHDAFWIAFGVVLSAFATAIAKLVEDKGDGGDQREDGIGDGNGKKYDEEEE